MHHPPAMITSNGNGLDLHLRYPGSSPPSTVENAWGNFGPVFQASPSGRDAVMGVDEKENSYIGLP